MEIAVKDVLLGKNVLAVLSTGYGKSLIFTLFLLARENITNINTLNTDSRIGIDRFHSRDRWPQWGGETIRNI
jgi:replicative superfamily II helicase